MKTYHRSFSLKFYMILLVGNLGQLKQDIAFIVPCSQLITEYFNMNNKTCATGGVGWNCLPEFAPNAEFSGVLVVYFVQLHVFTCLVPCCDVCYDFHIKSRLLRLFLY